MQRWSTAGDRNWVSQQCGDAPGPGRGRSGQLCGLCSCAGSTGNWVRVRPGNSKGDGGPHGRDRSSLAHTVKEYPAAVKPCAPGTVYWSSGLWPGPTQIKWSRGNSRTRANPGSPNSMHSFAPLSHSCAFRTRRPPIVIKSLRVRKNAETFTSMRERDAPWNGSTAQHSQAYSRTKLKWNRKEHSGERNKNCCLVWSAYGPRPTSEVPFRWSTGQIKTPHRPQRASPRSHYAVPSHVRGCPWRPLRPTLYTYVYLELVRPCMSLGYLAYRFYSHSLPFTPRHVRCTPHHTPYTPRYIRCLSSVVVPDTIQRTLLLY